MALLYGAKLLKQIGTNWYSWAVRLIHFAPYRYHAIPIFFTSGKKRPTNQNARSLLQIIFVWKFILEKILVRPVYKN